MSIDEAISHCLERANQDCSKCSMEHKQLAEWLIELKDRRASDNPDKPETIKHGHWFCKLSRCRFAFVHYECSVCREVVRENSNYCPHCGAKMMEEG